MPVLFKACYLSVAVSGKRARQYPLHDLVQRSVPFVLCRNGMYGSLFVFGVFKSVVSLLLSVK